MCKFIKKFACYQDVGVSLRKNTTYAVFVLASMQIVQKSSWDRNSPGKRGKLMGEIILSAHDLCRDFKIGDGSVVHALRSINIEIEKGKLTILRGRSGSGKTTLINILGALDRPTKGSVMFGGRDITKLSDKKRDDLRRREMAFVFQSVALMGGLTAFENVEFGLRLAGYPYEKRSARVAEVMKDVGLDKRMHHRPSEMSGGEQQRTAIARAIAHEPLLVFADEPTAELDTNTALHVVRLFKELVAQRGMTIVMTTHDPSMMDIADRVYTLEDGEIVEQQ